MSENKTPSPNLSTGIKSMLIILGVALSIIIFLIWSAIIQSGGRLATENIFADQSQTQTQTQEPVDSDDVDRVGPARDAVIAIVNAPSCESVENDAAVLEDLVTASLQQGGIADDDRQLIVDTLKKIDEACPKDFSLSLSDQLSGAGVSIELAQISVDANWVSKMRPAPEGAQALTALTTDGRNIHCTIESTRAACSIYTYTFPSIPASCETYTQTFVVSETGDTDALCSWRLQAENLVTSGTFANDTFACDVRDGGGTVECWSQLSGKGFEINRNGSRTF
ncbi:hypothetical protein [Flaviflexus equikiangi]|nr:hypothetical protein [Flaviflexus equikiangi]